MSSYIAFEQDAFDEWFKNLTRAGRVVCPVGKSLVLTEERLDPTGRFTVGGLWVEIPAKHHFVSPWVPLGAPE